MKLKHIIKEFRYDNYNWEYVRLSDPQRLRLNAETERVTLRRDATGRYPMDANLWVKSRLTNPDAVRKWLVFEKVSIKPEGTSISHRLSDGVKEYWFNGAIWVEDYTRWNTEAEINDGIEKFPTFSRKLQIVSNIKTENPATTPELIAVKILMASDINIQEDLLYRSLIPALKTINPISDMLIKLKADSDRIDLVNENQVDEGYNIIGIDSVFNKTKDPAFQDDLFQGFDLATKVIALKSRQPANDILLIRFIYQPEVAFTTSQAYHELAKFPALVIDGMEVIQVMKSGMSDAVKNKATMRCMEIHAPDNVTLRFTLLGITQSGVDQQRLAEEIVAFFARNPLIKSKGLDEEYSMVLIDEYRSNTRANLSDLHQGEAVFEVRHVPFVSVESHESPLVARAIVNSTMGN